MTLLDWIMTLLTIPYALGTVAIIQWVILAQEIRHPIRTTLLIFFWPVILPVIWMLMKKEGDQ